MRKLLSIIIENVYNGWYCNGRADYAVQRKSDNISFIWMPFISMEKKTDLSSKKNVLGVFLTYKNTC